MNKPKPRRGVKILELSTVVTAYSACQATTAALLQRSNTVEGQHFDISMLDSANADLLAGQVVTGPD